MSSRFVLYTDHNITEQKALRVILCRLPKKGRNETVVEETKERNREERGTGLKGKKQKEYPLKPHFHTVKLGFTGVYINFLISAQKHRLWVLVLELPH